MTWLGIEVVIGGVSREVADRVLVASQLNSADSMDI